MIVITPRSTRIRAGCICKDPTYVSDMFTDYSYSVEPWAKKSKMKQNKNTTLKTTSQKYYYKSTMKAILYQHMK